MSDTRKNNLITDILIACKANDVYIGGDLFLAIIFKTEAELVHIAQQLNIKVS